MRTGLAPTLTGSSLFSFQGTGAVQRRIPSLSQRPSDVKDFFSRPPRGWPRRESPRLSSSGFALWKDRARAPPGQWKIRKSPRDVKGYSVVPRKKRGPGPPTTVARERVQGSGVKPTLAPRSAGQVPGASSGPTNRPPNPLRAKGFPPPHFPDFDLPERVGRVEGLSQSHEGGISVPASPKLLGRLIPRFRST